MMSGTRKVTKQWKTKDGRKVRICDMTNDHLVNAIRFCKKTVKAESNHRLEILFALSSMVHGEMAEVAIDAEIDARESDPDGEDFMPDIYFKLVEEADRRGLDCENPPKKMPAWDREVSDDER